jgi:hypothetical protein
MTPESLRASMNPALGIATRGTAPLVIESPALFEI